MPLVFTVTGILATCTPARTNTFIHTHVRVYTMAREVFRLDTSSRYVGPHAEQLVQYLFSLSHSFPDTGSPSCIMQWLLDYPHLP